MSEQEKEAYSGDKGKAYLEKARESTLDRITETLESLEGNRRTAYVPTSDGAPIDRSGVTIGMGVDIGQMSSTELYNLDIPQSVKRKLNPFTSKTGREALTALESNPVTLEQKDIDKLNKAVKRKQLIEAEENVKEETGKSLYELPDSFRTGLVIQSFQLGNGLFRNRDGSSTNFRQEVMEGRYDDAADNMFTWNEGALPGLRKRYKAIGDLMKGNIQLSEVPDAARFYLNAIESGESGDTRYQGGTSNEDREPLEPTYSAVEQPADTVFYRDNNGELVIEMTGNDPIEEAGVRTVEPEEQEDGGLLNMFRNFTNYFTR